MSSVAVENPVLSVVFAFNASNQLAVRRVGAELDLAFARADLAAATHRLETAFPRHTPVAEYFSAEAGDHAYRVFFTQISGASTDAEVVFHSLDSLAAHAKVLTPALAALVAQLDPYLVDIPYLHLGENDFIYKFRPAQERNTAIYAQDAVAGALYQSQLCAAIKTIARQHERSAAAPITLDFGAVHYLIPSHFGFCLGVKNAIERAYETLAENPGRRVFMLSELIHNPFVNEDLLRRGLRYLQTDRGEAYAIDGRSASEAPGVPLLWDTLTPDDLVIIPAFGATDEDKRRLVRKGIAVCPYDATCMLVEKVWKAARTYGREGYTVIIHGKQEHEETKATFSNTRRHGHAVIVRNLDEARQLGEIIARNDPAGRARFYELFAGRHTPGFDVARHLERVAVVNQTTLLMNETLGIIEHLRQVYRAKFGDDTHVGGGGRRDTLCYATQVNQDALSRALAEPLDAAFVLGGKNSSNTYQLYRLCEQQLDGNAYFIQSERNILSLAAVEHHHYVGGGAGRTETRPLWPTSAGPTGGRPTSAGPTGGRPTSAKPMEGRPTSTEYRAGRPGHRRPGGGGPAPKRVLITGGASCPDGIIQQVITRINGFFLPDQIRDVREVLRGLEAMAAEPGAS